MVLIKYVLGFIYAITLRFKGVKIHPLARITTQSKFEGLNKINRNVAFIDSDLGLGSYINNSCYFPKTKIGKFCSIGSNVKIITGDHPLDGNISTHPSFFSLRKQAGFTFAEQQTFNEVKYADVNKNYCVRIENDVWIGSNVLILSGVTIKTGAVIAAGSLVIKDVEPYTIVGGVPAKKIKTRFSENEVSYLLQSKWWDKPVDWIKNNYLSFKDFKSFKTINDNFNRQD
ncbi:CatB-related O-acetyltransferase [Winogradskyella forsetii]|uniref:CatB-related O-acetyltransferase n=1 Tax=Winogradskyella forsetii TaxID=2686077 RepID=UPI001C4D536B|nr:CatB-related O-acetyltransferase [Winogradskyella forsetii]